jgi:hypothetical protein
LLKKQSNGFCAMRSLFEPAQISGSANPEMGSAQYPLGFSTVCVLFKFGGDDVFA